MEFLKANGVQACATIRSNRKCLPNDLKSDKNMQRDDFDFRMSKQGVTVYKWMDNEGVLVVSNFHGSEVTTVTRTQKDGFKKEFTCPVAVRDYNESMGGVDKADMLCAIHGLDRKSKKWWHRIFFGIIDRTLVNAQITYNQLGKGHLTTAEFRRSVALITISRQPRIGRPPLVSPPKGAKKRRRSNFSAPTSIRLENRGVHWLHSTLSEADAKAVSKTKRNPGRIRSVPHARSSLASTARRIVLVCSLGWISSTRQCMLLTQPCSPKFSV